MRDPQNTQKTQKKQSKKVGVMIDSSGHIKIVDANGEFILVPEDSGLWVCDGSTDMETFRQFLYYGYSHVEFPCIIPRPKPHQRTPKRKVFSLTKLFMKAKK